MQRIAVDLARVYRTPTGSELITTLAWGDKVLVNKITARYIEIRLSTNQWISDVSKTEEPTVGYIRHSKSNGIKPKDTVVKLDSLPILKVDFVDVQQGDGTVIESPNGKVIIIDGGDNQLFARYLAGRYRKSTNKKPKEIDAIVVSHGDADHFAGLTKIYHSEKHKTPAKRLFLHPKRVYHNGLVKRSKKNVNNKARKETELLGATKQVDGRTIVVGLETDLLKVPDSEMNRPFMEWKKTLNAWAKRDPITFRRLSAGDHEAFDFLEQENISIRVLAPLLTNSGSLRGLSFLGKPKKGPRIGHESLSVATDEFKGMSASHTINGHSIILKLNYGDFSFMFSGDLNDETGRNLVRAHKMGVESLQAEVFKVPHHGSADFSAAYLRAVSPVISVVSSGDESARKEYIHPRGTLLGALGRSSRVEEPLIFVTELVAFFNMEGYLIPEQHKMKNGVAVIKQGKAILEKKARERFFAFSRTGWGIVKVRTNGKRLLVYTNSGNARLKEVYAYSMGGDGLPIPDRVVQI
ncbi:MAG: ComEC/Rec2 family competence protein [Nitrospirales bacterium]